MKRNKSAVFIRMELIVAGLISAKGDERKNEKKKRKKKKKSGKATIYEGSR